MYIIFNEEGREQLRYFLNELPEELQKLEYRKVENIPEKEGFIERAKLENGEIVWEYEKIKDEVNTEDYIKELEEKQVRQSMETAMMIAQLQAEINILKGGE